MTPQFFIAKSFVTSIAFDVAESAQLSTNPILPTETSLHVEIGTRNSENNMYHLVEMHVHVSSNAEDGSSVYNLLLGYSAVVGSFDSFISETEWAEILKVQVPHALLDNIRSTVYQVTRDAGVPFMMRDDTFDNPIRNEEAESSEPLIDGIDDIIESVSDVETEYPESEQCLYNSFDAFCKDTPDAQESEKIDFKWMINFNWASDDPELLEVAQTFWSVYSGHFGEDTFVDYESLPIYKCYYRFFTPIEYLHPNFDECDESIWPILFQMLYGSLKSQCQVIDVDQDLPEIEFSYEHFQDRTISSLTLEELKELLSDLITEALVDISVNLLGYQNEIVLSEEQSQNNQLISERDFYHIFDANVSDENASFLGMMYEKIKECNLQTLLYQTW